MRILEDFRALLSGRRVRIAERQNDPDFLWGAKAIASYLGLQIGQVCHLVSKKRLPVTKLSRSIMVARRLS